MTGTAVYAQRPTSSMSGGSTEYLVTDKKVKVVHTRLPSVGFPELIPVLGRGDIPALTPAEAGTRLSDPGGMQG